MSKRRANGEGWLYKRKDGNWVAQYCDYEGKKHYLYGKTQQAVKDKLKEAIRLSDAEISVDARKITFSAWIEEWLEAPLENAIKKPCKPI